MLLGNQSFDLLLDLWAGLDGSPGRRCLTSFVSIGAFTLLSSKTLSNPFGIVEFTTATPLLVEFD